MASSLISSFYRFRMFINCKGGGYVEDYNLATPVTGSPPIASTGAKTACKAIAALRGILLEGNSRIANMVLSVETAVDDNPAEGYELPHNIAGAPVLLNDPVTNVIETNIGVASDPSQAIAYYLDTNEGFAENRTIRSLRSSWVTNFPTLAAAMVPLAPVVPATPTGVVPRLLIEQFMSYLRDNTVLIQSPLALAPQFRAYTFPPPATLTNPVVIGLTRRKVGKGWPHVRGRQPNFA